MRREGWQNWLPWLLLPLVVASVYGHTVGHGFVWDDHLYLANNPLYRSFALGKILTSPGNGLEYLPVRDLSHLLDFLLWGPNPAGFHLANLVYFALAVLAAYRLASTLAADSPGGEGSEPRLTGFVAALLFAVLPLQSEVVGFLTGRNALLSTLFAFVAATLYFRSLDEGEPLPGRRLRYAGALVAYLLALFAKATAISLPLALAVLPLVRGGRKLRLVPLAPFFLVAGGAFLLFTRIAAQANILRWDTAAAGGGLAGRLATALQIPFFYLGKFLAPLTLSPEYDVIFSRYLLDPLVLAALAGLLLLVGVAWWLRRRSPCVAVGLGWFLVTLLPVLNLLPTHPTVADRYAFLPSFGLCYLLAAGGMTLLGRRRRLLAAVLLLLAGGWGWLAHEQSRVWQSDASLWEATIRSSPRSVKAYTNLGRIRFREGQYDRALALFGQAQAIEPTDPHLDYFTGVLAYSRNDIAAAQRHFVRALGRNLQFIEALYHLGLIYEAQGDPVRAAEYFRLALRSPEPDVGTFKQLAAERLRAVSGGSTPAGSTFPGQ